MVWLSQDYDELLRSLEQTQYVVQQYLPTTLASVTGALQKISEYNGAFLRQLRDEHLDELREIQTQLNEYKKDHEKRQKFQQQKGEEEGQLAPLKQREEKILRRLTEYKKTSAYEEYQRLAQQKQPLMNELQKEKQDLQQPFLHLSYALHKYHYENDPLVQKQTNDQKKIQISVINVMLNLSKQKKMKSLRQWLIRRQK